MLLQLWSRLVEKFGEGAPQLIIIGQRGWECDQVFDVLDQPGRIRGKVAELGRCSDQDLAIQLAKARAVLFPSLAEGYGLPLAESLRAGVPVIASDLPVFREIAGEIPEYLDPSDIQAWEDAIIDYSDKKHSRRVAHLARLKDFNAPTWQSHFAAIDAWMATL
ncbi:hypothetical protein GCM10022276_13980 [Sphingomonas limnosediminicola]|uniref:Glycosyl transferase family 1 domain-containing protein n=2 Tax=Sphingomonas limnosediminicola TaxID=940133 RepID=A0ABP7L8G5_9SPHN